MTGAGAVPGRSTTNAATAPTARTTSTASARRTDRPRRPDGAGPRLAASAAAARVRHLFEGRTELVATPLSSGVLDGLVTAVSSVKSMTGCVGAFRARSTASSHAGH